MNSAQNSTVPVVIVGAGPYGLSLAAHLREAGIPFRIFGRPMQSWATQMPAGMKLKSDGFASNLSGGSIPFTLEDFCRLTGRPYHPTQIPVAVEDFVAYGEEFARRLVPHLEQTNVTNIERKALLDHHDRLSTGFLLTLATGELLRAQHVVLATGLSLFQHVPQKLAFLSRELVTHTSDHTSFSEFANRDVVVLGRGASSLNAAALLHEAGSRVTLLTRGNRIDIHPAPTTRPRPLIARLRRPVTPLGHSWRSWFSCAAPGLFHALPAAVRRGLVYKHLGPAGGSALQGRIQGKLPILLNWSIESCELVSNVDKLDKGNQNEPLLKLLLVNEAGERRQLLTSHVIAGTGFRFALSRLRFLADAIRTRIQVYESGAPRLSRSFESSVLGLYFVGPAGSASFGPLLRFAAGSEYAATRLTRHLQRVLAIKPSPVVEQTTAPAPITR